MLVKYKTILYGDKPAHKGLDGKAVFEPKEAAKYKVISCDFCCYEMEHYIEGSPFYFSDSAIPEPCYFVYISYKYGDGCDEEIKYCPFCGEKIEYKEVKKTRYKKIKSIDYIEEAVK